MKDQIWASA